MAGKRPKVLVLLGAGASYDAWNGAGPPVINPGWQPPLAKELFGVRPAFWEVLNQYRGARILASELGELARGDTPFNIELKLKEYANHADPRIVEHFKEVPPYLRHLIIHVVLAYTGGHNPGTHQRLVLALLSREIDVAFLDLNYDPYIEMALEDFDSGLVIRQMEDYVAEGRQAIVCKVHGAIDWGTPLGQMAGAGHSWMDSLRTFDVQKRGETIFCRSSRPNPTHFAAPDGRFLYPVLTAPLAGKGNTDLVCPAPHRDALRAFLRECERYLIIGTSGQDEDVLSLLDESVHSVKAVQYVSDTDAAAIAVRERFEKACRAFRKGVTEVATVAGGFRSYLSSDHFDTFLRRCTE